MELSEDKFREIIANTPLVSIDLLVEKSGNYLVGLRKNRPAKGKLFVPGGRILKGESLSVAFERILNKELGISRSINDASFVTVSEHHYPDSMFDPEISTHYVVLSYRLTLKKCEEVQIDNQHQSFLWLSEDEIRQHPNVHVNTIRHFPIKNGKPPLLKYYSMMINQLHFYNKIVWAFPAAYLALLFFSVEKVKDMPLVLFIMSIFLISLLYVFTRHCSNQKAIIKLVQSLEQQIEKEFGSEFIPHFKRAKFKATTVMQFALYLGTIALFCILIFFNDKSNQSLQPTVKTPVELGKVQGTAAEL